MKKIIIVLVLLMFAAGLFAFTSDHNVIAAQQGGDTAAAPATGAGIMMGKDTGIYEFKPGSMKKPDAKQAQPQAKPQKKKAQSKGDEVIVTARQIPETLGVVARMVTVITAEEIAKKGYTSLAQVLHNTPGFFVKKNGGQGLQSLLSRGVGSKQTLIMVDGVPISKDHLVGGTDLSLVDISGIEKIEIISGGMSSVYGADASAGVVNIITGTEDKKIVKAKASYGTFNTHSVEVGSAYKVFNIDYSITGKEEKSHGYRENTAYNKRSAKAKIGFVKDNREIFATGYYLKREMGVPGTEGEYSSPNDYQNEENYSVSLNINLDMDSLFVNAHGFVSSADFFYHSEDPSFGDSRHIKKEMQGNILGTYNEGDFVSIVAGYDLNMKDLNSTDVGVQAMTNNGMFTSVTTMLLNNFLIINVGARADINSAYGVMDSENISVKYKLSGDVELNVSYESAFSAPTLGQLFWPEYYYAPYFTTYKPNPDLKPELTKSYEVGIGKKDKMLKESVKFFKRNVVDLIKGKYIAPGVSQYHNIKNVSVMGLEAEVSFDPFDFIGIDAQYTFIHSTNTDTGEKLKEMPEGKLTGQMTVSLPYKTVLTLSGEYTDYREDFGVVIPEYYLLDLNVVHELNDNASVFVNVKNILDNNTYEQSLGYPLPGRTVMAGLGVKF